MLLVKAQLQVHEGRWSELQMLPNRLLQASLAEEGCLRFEVFLNPADAAHVVVLQEWRDQTSLERHEDSAHVAAFKQQAASMMKRYAPTQIYVVERIEALSSFLPQDQTQD